MAKRAKEPAPESGIIKVVDPLYDAPVAVEIPQAPPAPSGPTIGKRVRRFFELVLRLISWIIIFTVFGAALYYAVPLLYQRFVVPVEQNTAQVGELQAQQQLLESQLAELQEKLAAIETGQEQQVESLGELDERMGQLEAEIGSHTKSLASLEDIQSQLQKQDQLTSAELESQIDLMKSVELLSRARLYMYQSNFGLARADVEAARELLTEVQPNADVSLETDLEAVIRRLDLVLTNLPSFPVAASDDLDIAWQILITGMPPVNTAATAMPAGTLSSTPEPTASMPPTPTP